MIQEATMPPGTPGLLWDVAVMALSLWETLDELEDPSESIDIEELLCQLAGRFIPSLLVQRLIGSYPKW